MRMYWRKVACMSVRIEIPLVLQGTDRDEQHLNIFLEFVPGGSIASLLAKFGAALRCKTT